MGWVDEAKGRSVLEVAGELGLAVRGRTFGPCPQCRAERREGEGRRGPIGVTSNDRGWRCHRCGVGGSTVDLVGQVLGVPPTSKRAWEWWDGRGGAAPALPPRILRPSYPPKRSILRLWRQGTGVDAEDAVAQWLESRGLEAEAVRRRGLAKSIRGEPPRWAKRWVSSYRIILPLVDAEGQLRSLKFRRTDPRPGPKSLNPTGFSVQGLLMANAAAVRMLRGEAVRRVFVVEGGPDWLTVGAWCQPDDAVFGLVEGGWDLRVARKVPKQAQVVVATHHDEKGRQYAALVAASVNVDSPPLVPNADSLGDLNERWQAGDVFDPLEGLEPFRSDDSFM